MIYRTNDITGRPECVFEAKLLSISNEVKEMKNDNKTPYRVATIEFADQQGEVQKVSAIVYDKSFQHGMEVGKSYLTTASENENSDVFVAMSHLTYTKRAAAEMFNFKSVGSVSEVNEEAFTAAQ